MNNTTSSINNSLPFLSSSSSLTRKRPISSASARTEVFRLMNGLKTASKLEQDQYQSRVRTGRSHQHHFSNNRNSIDDRRMTNNCVTSEDLAQRRQEEKTIPKPPSSSSSAPFITSGTTQEHHHHQRQHVNPIHTNNCNNKNKTSQEFVQSSCSQPHHQQQRRQLRSDAAHLWWPEQFDGIAFSEQLEQLSKITSNSSSTTGASLQSSKSKKASFQSQSTGGGGGSGGGSISKKDVHTAFDALDLVKRTLTGTPAAEVLDHVSEILQQVCFRPVRGRTIELKEENDQRDQEDQHHYKQQKQKQQHADCVQLNRDLVLGLELEVSDLRRRLATVQKSYDQLRDSTAKQVASANSRRISTDINSTVNSEEVAEATILRVQNESAEMATRLQQSLAQQQMIRGKLIDLGMRNVELRNILEAQKRAATARSWEDVMPRAAVVGGGDDADNNSSGANTAGGGGTTSTTALDRSALMLLGDVVSSSQTELANLVEFRQKLSTAVYGE